MEAKGSIMMKAHISGKSKGILLSECGVYLFESWLCHLSSIVY